MIKIYTLPNCVQCDTTKRYLDNKGIPYESVDMSINTDAYNEAVSLGYKSAPVVFSEDTHWSGFRIDLLNKLSA